MINYKATITAGLAMFAMFFGSGNLVFPLIVGATTADQYQFASLGLMLTGVLVPFLGLLSMIVFQGDKNKLFGLLGKYSPFILSLLILSLIGPFGVVPRCLLVSYGSLKVIFPELNLILFGSIFIVLIYFIIFQKNEIVPLIGNFLGPLKIAAIGLIIIVAYVKSPALVSLPQQQSPFLFGIIEGYETMDLMAAFFFSMTIVEYLSSVSKTKKETLTLGIFSSIIGAFFIAIIYIGFVYLGAHYALELKDISPEQYIVKIAQLTLGSYATIIVSLTIALSCLVTASSLVKLFAEFLTKDICRDKISWNFAVIITLAISFLLSLTGFTSIMVFLDAILVYAYPALIILAISSILTYFFKFNYNKEAFWITLVVCAILKQV